MADACIQPIVEGHGEVEAIRVLLERFWFSLPDPGGLTVLPPIRQPRSRIIIEQHLGAYVELAARKLAQAVRSSTKVVLVLLDADRDLPCELGPRVLQMARNARPDLRIAAVVANREYETWFAASAESLIAAGYIDPQADRSDQPEARLLGKGWVKRWITSGHYSETVDQAKLSALIDFEAARQRSPSLDKLCRELEAIALVD